MAGISGSAFPGGVSAPKAQGGLIVTGLCKSFGKTRANDDISVRLNTRGGNGADRSQRCWENDVS